MMHFSWKIWPFRVSFTSLISAWSQTTTWEAKELAICEILPAYGTIRLHSKHFSAYMRSICAMATYITEKVLSSQPKRGVFIALEAVQLDHA